MGWLGNRLRRGMTHRAFDQIVREVGADAPSSAFFAVAVAAAAYPNAVYGSADWDKHNDKLPAPVVDPRTALNISEVWIGQQKMCWEECILHLYGCDPNQLVALLKDAQSEKSLAEAAVSSDVAAINEEVRRSMAEANRRSEANAASIYRLNEVLNEYFLYTRGSQLELAEASIILAIAALAYHENREDCKAYVYALSDILYSSTDDANNSLSKSERKQLRVAAMAVQKYLNPKVNKVLQGSADKLIALGSEDVLRLTFESLHNVHCRYLEHTSWRLLQKLIGYCIIMDSSMQSEKVGLTPKVSSEEAILNVANTSSEIARSVFSRVESGKLVVQDGKIIKPNRDEDNE